MSRAVDDSANEMEDSGSDKSSFVAVRRRIVSKTSKARHERKLELEDSSDDDSVIPRKKRRLKACSATKRNKQEANATTLHVPTSDQESECSEDDRPLMGHKRRQMANNIAKAAIKSKKRGSTLAAPDRDNGLDEIDQGICKGGRPLSERKSAKYLPNTTIKRRKQQTHEAVGSSAQNDNDDVGKEEKSSKENGSKKQKAGHNPNAAINTRKRGTNGVLSSARAGKNNWLEESSDDEISKDGRPLVTKEKNATEVPKAALKRSKRRKSGTGASARTTEDGNGSSKDESENENSNGIRKATRKIRKNDTEDKSLQTYGDYVLQFQDDSTGIRQLHPSAMRYGLKVLEDEAGRTIQSVASSLRENGEEAETRTVLEQSTGHVEEIGQRVRRRLGNTMIPARYVKIEDLVAADLEVTNTLRREEIEENRAIEKQLVQQRKLLQKGYDEAKARRDRLQEELDAGDDHTGALVHPLLRESAASACASSTFSAPPTSNGTLSSLPKDAMATLLSNVQSPYD